MTCGGITSGGGFSIHYPVPPWQSSAVQVEGTDRAPCPGYANGRGYPDISAAGANIKFVPHGGPVAGTL